MAFCQKNIINTGEKHIIHFTDLPGSFFVAFSVSLCSKTCKNVFFFQKKNALQLTKKPPVFPFKF